MRLFTTVAGLRCYLNHGRSVNRLHHPEHLESDPSLAPPLTIGLVPTMGALHAGHLSLIERARQETDLLVVSIFVNPLQFGPNEDFQRYPRTLEADRTLCEQAGVDVIFAPTVSELYGPRAPSRGSSSELSSEPSSNESSSDESPDEPSSDASLPPSAPTLTQVIPPASLTTGLCGRSRPGHFTGVATVVTLLFNIVQPDRAYFGQKDAQQVAIIKRLVADLQLPIEVMVCPIVREADGLALSSRNRYLSTEERRQAPAIYHSLKQAERAFRQGVIVCDDLLGIVAAELATVSGIRPDYIQLVHPETMAPLNQIESKGLLAVAAHVGSARLIDNLVLQHRQPIVAIDGPAGAGKSTVARRVAQALGLLYLDTGAMYRAVTWLVLQSGVAVEDTATIAELVSRCDIQLEPQPQSALPALTVRVNGQDVTQAIRSLEVTAQVSTIAAQPCVRRELVRQQQAYGERGGIVMDGRDIGTHVFPDAELKIFLTASVQERARRRQIDLQQQGKSLSVAELETAIQERDRKDSTRQFAPLRQAADAIELPTDDLTIDEVTAKIIRLYQEKLASLPGNSI